MKKINKFLVLFFFFSLSFYGQNDTISVVRHSDNDLIIPKNLKVVYRGIPNNLLIEVPNCKSFTASANGLVLISKNNYNLNPGSGTEVIITIDIVLKNNKKITEKHKFEIKNIKSLVSSINSSYTDIKISKNQLENSLIKVEIPDKNLNLGFRVTGFTIFLKSGKTFEIKGNKIDKVTIERLNRIIQKGDKIKISDIKFVFSKDTFCGMFCKVNSLNIEIL
jgi:hypothetical protein